jgi:DNA-binding ferritin-like protein
MLPENQFTTWFDQNYANLKGTYNHHWVAAGTDGFIAAHHSLEELINQVKNRGLDLAQVTFGYIEADVRL